MRVAPDPLAAMAYIRELDDEAVSFGDVASNMSVDMNNKRRECFRSGGCRMSEGQERTGPEILKLIQSRVRIVDPRHLHESTHFATEANTKIQELSCSGLSELDSYMASSSLFRHQMGLIAHHSEETEGRKAQKWLQQPRSLMPRRQGGKHNSKKGNDKPCEHCHKPGHTAQKCWLNPKSSAYRPDCRPKSMAAVTLRPMEGRLRSLVWELRPLGLGLGLQFRQMSSPRRSRSSSPSGSVVPHGLPISGRTHFSSLRAQRGLWILVPVNFAAWAKMPMSHVGHAKCRL